MSFTVFNQKNKITMDKLLLLKPIFKKKKLFFQKTEIFCYDKKNFRLFCAFLRV